MIRKIFLLLFLMFTCNILIQAQSVVSASDLFRRSEGDAGQLKIDQDAAIDSLMNIYIDMGRRNYEETGYYAMEGYRIQIYNSSNRNAREESNKTNAEFINKFPDLISYQLYSYPGWFKVRVGDFRTKAEATKVFLTVSKVFPGSYIVPDLIKFPELNNR
jgi:hypothetical protein